MSNELRVENLQSPWPESIWTMTEDEYVKAVPDEKLRTAISGFLMREGWVIAKQEILAIVKADECEDKYHGDIKAKWFLKGANSIKRRNKSGCCCIIDDDSNVVTACQAHLSWKADDDAEYYDKVLDIKNRPSWKI